METKCNNLPRRIYFISSSVVIQQIIQRGEPRVKYNLILLFVKRLIKKL